MRNLWMTPALLLGLGLVACTAEPDPDPVDASTPLDATTPAPDAGTPDTGIQPDAATAPLCDAYCDNVLTNCTGANQVYADRPSCLAACAAMPDDGSPGAIDGNSVQCRIYHAGAPAMADPATHCPHTTISGGGVCGTPCDAYCDQALANCTGANQLFADRPSCLATCARFPQTGTATATEGNSVQCRAYHASFPSVADATVHCPHASTTGGGLCGGYCDGYCDQIMNNCAGANQIYASRNDCMATCSAFPTTGAPGAVDGNSVQCRAYHASFPARADATVHCPHASATGGGACGTPCEAYCDQVGSHCTGADAQYPDRASCLASCVRLPQVDSATVTSGNSVECRIYHASFPAVADSETHCPHAGTSGGGACGSRCEGYCAQVMGNCPGTYPDETACMLACATFRTTGMENATAGNSVQCRTYHASFPANGDGLTHCPHAAISGGGACGTYCETYCDYLDTNCTGANAQYGNRAACEAACVSIPTTGMSNATSGNTIQCRAYHASFPAAADPATHCSHAGPTGGVGGCE